MAREILSECQRSSSAVRLAQADPLGLRDRHASARMHSCFAAGKLLDLTSLGRSQDMKQQRAVVVHGGTVRGQARNGSVGLPNCVERCVPPAERSIQGLPQTQDPLGVAFSCTPVTAEAKEAFDVSFTLELRNVSLKQLPSTVPELPLEPRGIRASQFLWALETEEQLRMNVPVALGQALQVPPGDVLGEVFLGKEWCQDLPSFKVTGQRYDSHTLHSFKLRRRDEMDEPGWPTKRMKHDKSRRVQTDPPARRGWGRRAWRGHACKLFIRECRQLFDDGFAATVLRRGGREAGAPWLRQALASLVKALSSLKVKVEWQLECAADQHCNTVRFPETTLELQGNLTGKWNEPLAETIRGCPVLARSSWTGGMPAKEFGDIAGRLKYEEKTMEQTFDGIE
eukprot:Skav225277  [mRNA]  locus=scaffold4099:178794:182719:+ [translate_table: standard]